ncbi:TetR/AcrR family transcriptional regulator [Actinomadura livida]|uniref:AcrR family transcriptional regulator n=1 Tax=Actinomadura livida TaxID=79909 RepID=A0A7W7IID4_9ACTN|nr:MULTISPECIES: TetR/AcrR family transcriptional regulator [Actinomadura]MBB4777555.1 AcrR family transcriptional regulator [Actinomadura catellatispora]GGU00322.1 TetR family transcriptional regulator [Actinomadura livida]
MPAAITQEQQDQDRGALLDVAEHLFYSRGVQAVGMDELRTVSGLPLKRIYRLFPTKESLVVAMLERRDRRWRESLAAHVAKVPDARERVLAMFDWLGEWFAEPGFRGCAWANVHGELGPSSPAIAAAVRAHKRAFHDQVVELVTAVAPPAAEPIHLLAEGAILVAGIHGDPTAAATARTGARALLDTTS